MEFSNIWWQATGSDIIIIDCHTNARELVYLGENRKVILNKDCCQNKLPAINANLVVLVCCNAANYSIGRESIAYQLSLKVNSGNVIGNDGSVTADWLYDSNYNYDMRFCTVYNKETNSFTGKGWYSIRKGNVVSMNMYWFSFSELMTFGYQMGILK